MFAVPAYHVEYQMPTQYQYDFYRAVFDSMDQLEGWCCKEKAFILMNMILATKPQIIVEIGVFGGKSLVPMAYALRTNGTGMIYGIDPWETEASISGMEGKDKEYWNEINHQKIFSHLLLKIQKFNLQMHTKLIRATSKEASEIQNIDILHIDGNHSEASSLFDVMKWVPLVKKGGFIILDDLTWGATENQTGTTHKAVQWVNSKCQKIAEFRADNVWGIWIKK